MSSRGTENPDFDDHEIDKESDIFDVTTAMHTFNIDEREHNVTGRALTYIRQNYIWMLKLSCIIICCLLILLAGLIIVVVKLNATTTMYDDSGDNPLELVDQNDTWDTLTYVDGFNCRTYTCNSTIVPSHQCANACMPYNYTRRAVKAFICCNCFQLDPPVVLIRYQKLHFPSRYFIVVSTHRDVANMSKYDVRSLPQPCGMRGVWSVVQDGLTAYYLQYEILQLYAIA